MGSTCLDKLRSPQVEHELRVVGHILMQREALRVLFPVVSKSAMAQACSISALISQVCAILRTFHTAHAPSASAAHVVVEAMSAVATWRTFPCIMCPVARLIITHGLHSRDSAVHQGMQEERVEVCDSPGGQTDEGAVNPACGVKVLLSLHLEGGQPCHCHCSCLLVKSPDQLLRVIPCCPSTWQWQSVFG